MPSDWASSPRKRTLLWRLRPKQTESVHHGETIPGIPASHPREAREGPALSVIIPPMSKVQPINRTEAEESLHKVYENLEQSHGFTPDIFKIMAHSPPLLRSVAPVFQAMETFELSPLLRELAYLQASLTNGSDYCVAHHAQAAQKAGLSDEQLQTLKRGDYEGFDEVQGAVILFAKQMSGATYPEPHTMKILNRNLGHRELVELAFVVGLANLTNRFNHALEIEPERTLAR